MNAGWHLPAAIHPVPSINDWPKPTSLATLVAKPRVNLIRFHGVFAPNSRWRQQVTPARRGRGCSEAKTAAQRQVAMTWAQRLKRVFKIDIETCSHCGGTVKVIASIEDPAIIKQILDHIQQHSESVQPKPHPVRAPPQYTLPVPS